MFIFKNREIIDLSVDNIKHWDSPDYVDAYIDYAVWKDTGIKLTDTELDELNEDSSLVYDAVMAYLY